MQKDFHYDVIYVLAVWAGFNPDDSFKIAYSSQYVDDVEDAGRIKFNNKASYTCTSSAHAILDVSHNSDEVENHNTWLPFHFLPGYGGCQKGKAPDMEFEDLLVCIPNSYVARDMVKAAINACGKMNGIYRFGIALHTYADTWAHQGFIGAVTEKNKVHNIRRKLINGPLENISIADALESRGIDEVLPVGHGPALSNPDMPFFEEWRFDYLDDRGEQVYKNTANFLEAADNILQVMRLFQEHKKDPLPLEEDLAILTNNIAGLTEEQRNSLSALFNDIQDEAGDDRHTKWGLGAQRGEIPGVDQIPDYFSKGEGAWKYLALGKDIQRTSNDTPLEYHPSFLNSDWKGFHDALQEHRQYVLLELLPSFGICVS